MHAHPPTCKASVWTLALALALSPRPRRKSDDVCLPRPLGTALVTVCLGHTLQVMMGQATWMDAVTGCIAVSSVRERRFAPTASRGNHGLSIMDALEDPGPCHRVIVGRSR